MNAFRGLVLKNVLEDTTVFTREITLVQYVPKLNTAHTKMNQEIN